MRRCALVIALLGVLACKREPEPTPSARAAPCGRVVFVENDADGRAQVRAIAATGGAITPLTLEPVEAAVSIYPAATSPDGRRMLLLSSRQGDEGVSHDRLWLADLDRPPRPAVPLTIELELQLRSPSWSPDGRWLVLESGQHSFRDLYRVDVGSGSVLRLTDDPEGNFEPTIGPDETIAFVSSRDGNAEIYVMSSDGGDPRRLTNNPRDDTGPRWSPDGQTLAFCSGRERDRGVDVFLMNADGRNQRPLIGERSEAVLVSQLEFSPDGELLAFTDLTPKRGAGAVVIARVEDGEIVQRIAGEGVYEQPSWSPDGSFVASAHSHDGRSRIVITRVDTGESEALTDGASEQWLPRWIADADCPHALAGTGRP